MQPTPGANHQVVYVSRRLLRRGGKIVVDTPRGPVGFLLPPNSTAGTMIEVAPYEHVGPDEWRDSLNVWLMQKRMPWWYSAVFLPLALTASFLAIIGPGLYKVFRSARIAADMTDDLHRINAIGRAAQLYATDNNDHFPLADTTTRCKSLLTKYLRSNEQGSWTSPAAGNRYLYNLECSGRALDQIDNPSEAIIFLESRPVAYEFRAAEFCDAHSRGLNQAQSTKYRIEWKPDAFKCGYGFTPLASSSAGAASP